MAIDAFSSETHIVAMPSRSAFFQVGNNLIQDIPGEISITPSTLPVSPTGLTGLSRFPGNILDQIVAYLENNDARGLRHFVRFGSQNASIAMFNFVQNEHRYAGVIHDISSGGISCTFKPEPEHLEHLPVTRMNVSLPTGMVSLSGRFTAGRMVAGQPVHIFEFDPEPAEEAKKHIYNFIYASLETKLSLH